MAVVCTKRSFLHVFLVHQDLVKPLPEVELREPGGLSQFVEELVNRGYGKPITDRDGVECSVIDA